MGVVVDVADLGQPGGDEVLEQVLVEALAPKPVDEALNKIDNQVTAPRRLRLLTWTFRMVAL